MKRIFVNVNMRNESDIVESFCRYNLTFCDGMFIYERASSDNTNEIIRKLIAEGFPIHLEDDPNVVFGSFEVDLYGDMACKAINEYGADLVVHLDTDEFLYHTDGINPREALESLREDVEYQIPWRTYVYEKEPDIDLGFLPNNFTHYRNPALECHNKAIASKYLIEKKQAKFAPSATHSLTYPHEYRGSVEIKSPSKLVYAHFPLRSKAQLMNKVVPNWIYYWKKPLPVWEGEAFQYGLMWDELKEKGEISHDSIVQHCIKYGVPDDHLAKLMPEIENSLTIEGQMDVSFCSEKLGLRYTDYSEMDRTFLRATLTEVESAVMSLPKREWETIRLYKELQNENNALTQQNNALTQEISRIHKSKIWKIGKRLKRAFRFLKPFKLKRRQFL